MNSSKHTELKAEAWSVADLLRGNYKRSDYGKVILPFLVLRRLECVLEPTRKQVVETHERFKDRDINDDAFLRRASGHAFYNRSTLTLRKIAADPQSAEHNLSVYLSEFSENVRGVMDRFSFHDQIKRLADADLLYKVIGKFTDLDLHPNVVSNHNMGYLFEDLIRRFSELSNETAGEHFTPREVIRLMVQLLIGPDGDAIQFPSTVRTVMDPACGTGGMLSAAEDMIVELNPDAKVGLYGQELNPESWAICRSDLMIKGHEGDDIAFGNSFSDDGHKRAGFDYLLANPPFGVEWKNVKEAVEEEYERDGTDGRFGAGLPRINDGSLLFLQHMISKMKPVGADGKGGSRVAIVFNGSPLFTGAAGSGESEIRRWILRNDWLEAIVALPDQLFYNTGISTYFWILTNRKSPEHKGKVVLLDARDQWQKMPKSLGNKRKELGDQHIQAIVKLYGEALQAAADDNHPQHAKVKVFDNDAFGCQRITVERPLKLRFEVTDETLGALAAAKPIQRLEHAEEFVDAVATLKGTTWSKKADAFLALRDAVASGGLLWPAGAPITKALRDTIGVRDPEGEVQELKGSPEPDPDLRDYENVPLGEDVNDYLKREVLPHAPDAWIDPTKSKIGYEIPLTRHFYVYQPPRPLTEIDVELKALEAEIQELLREVTE